MKKMYLCVLTAYNHKPICRIKITNVYVVVFSVTENYLWRLHGVEYLYSISHVALAYNNSTIPIPPMFFSCSQSAELLLMVAVVQAFSINITWYLDIFLLTHWGRVTHICVSKLTIIGSDNALSPEQPQAIGWTSAVILLIGTLGTNFSEILSKIHTYFFKKMHLKTSSVKWQPFCLGLNVLILITHGSP